MARDEKVYKEALKRKKQEEKEERRRIRQVEPDDDDEYEDDAEYDIYAQSNEEQVREAAALKNAIAGASNPDQRPVRKAAPPLRRKTSAELLAEANRRHDALFEEVKKIKEAIAEENAEISLLREQAKKEAEREANEAKVRADEAQARVEEAKAANAVVSSKNVPDEGETTYSAAYMVDDTKTGKRYLMLDIQMAEYFAPGGAWTKVPVMLRGGKIVKILTLEEAAKNLDVYEVAVK